MSEEELIARCLELAATMCLSDETLVLTKVLGALAAGDPHIFGKGRYLLHVKNPNIPSTYASAKYTANDLPTLLHNIEDTIAWRNQPITSTPTE